MTKTPVFISFDFDNDEGLKHLLVGQSKKEDSPFDIGDHSVKEPLTGDWKEKVRRRIRNVKQVIVICGEFTDSANGVSAEVEIAQEEEIPYFLLKGLADKVCARPKSARTADKMYKWTWDNLKLLISGAR